MITGYLYKQYPKPSKKPIYGTVSCDQKRMFLWENLESKNTHILAELRVPEIVHASTKGVLFRGFEPYGFDKTGREITKYQEWWITK